MYIEAAKFKDFIHLLEQLCLSLQGSERANVELKNSSLLNIFRFIFFAMFFYKI